ncbi:MAG: phosphate acyltransferase PlsX [Clostridia bacterium]|nr:phosphate acyltransferase PlsX [Clostridia bacterium]
MKIILDAMGGDHAPKAAVEGAVLAAEKYGCNIILVGRQEEIDPILAGRCADRITVRHASEVITMEDKYSTAFRQKKDSSMTVSLNMLNTGEGDVVISAGSTGALLTGATLLNKRIKGIRRAALGAPLPQKTGGFALLMDSGANAECTPEFLLQFAFMGSLYMKTQCGIEQPRVALINNGTEEGKGDPLRHETYELLMHAHNEGRINFVGNMEGRNVLAGEADVLVCDGFTGNVLMKTVEGTAGFIMKELKEILYANLPSKLAALVLKPGLSKLKNKMDYKNIGGAPMLGIAKPVIKAHGSSDARAFCSAMEQAMLFAHSGFIGQVESNMEYMTVPGEKA